VSLFFCAKFVGCIEAQADPSRAIGIEYKWTAVALGLRTEVNAQLYKNSGKRVVVKKTAVNAR